VQNIVTLILHKPRQGFQPNFANNRPKNHPVSCMGGQMRVVWFENGTG